MNNSDSICRPTFEDLASCHYGALYQFAFALARSEADASYLTQETFRIWAAEGHQLREPHKVKTWLFTTMHRLFLECCRRQMRFPHCELSQAAAELPEVPSNCSVQADAASVLQALSRVDEVYQAAVALFYLEDSSYKEIAVILGVPIGTVKSRIARGIAQLRELLDSGATRSVPAIRCSA